MDNFVSFLIRLFYWPVRVLQLVARLTQEPEVSGSILLRPQFFVSLSADPRRAVISYWRKYEHEVLVYRLGGLSLPMESVVRLTDRTDIITSVYVKQ